MKFVEKRVEGQERADIACKLQRKQQSSTDCLSLSLIITQSFGHVVHVDLHAVSDKCLLFSECKRGDQHGVEVVASIRCKSMFLVL